MKTKIYTQSILIIILIIISLFVFLKYFSKTNLKSEIESPAEEILISGESLIVDLKYFSTDKKGNEYEIVAKKGNIDRVDVSQDELNEVPNNLPNPERRKPERRPKAWCVWIGENRISYRGKWTKPN